MRDNRAAFVVAAFDQRGQMFPRQWAQAVQAATLHGCLNRVAVKSQTLAARVLLTVIELHDNPRGMTPAAAVRAYCDCIWTDGSTRYQGLIAGALERGEFLSTWRQLSDGIASQRERLAYQCALFARNWLTTGRDRQRLFDFANWLTN